MIYSSRRSRARAKLFKTDEKGLETIFVRAMIFMSYVAREMSCFSRHSLEASRNRLFARLRSTALPIFLLAVKPSRFIPTLFFSKRIINSGATIFLPCVFKCTNCFRAFKRSSFISLRWCSLLTRTVFYDPEACAVLRFCDHSWWPCACGSRADVCGQDGSVDMCASFQSPYCAACQ